MKEVENDLMGGEEERNITLLIFKALLKWFIIWLIVMLTFQCL